MASMANVEGPKGFSLESSRMSRARCSIAAGVLAGAFVVPISRAGLETRSKKRLMRAAHHAMEGLLFALGLLQAVRRRSTSRQVRERGFPGGTSKVTGSCRTRL